jgi:hypothetical protein
MKTYTKPIPFFRRVWLRLFSTGHWEVSGPNLMCCTEGHWWAESRASLPDPLAGITCPACVITIKAAVDRLAQS